MGQALYVSYAIYFIKQPFKLGTIIVLILLRMEVNHRDELQSLYRVHVPVFFLLFWTAFQGRSGSSETKFKLEFGMMWLVILNLSYSIPPFS